MRWFITGGCGFIGTNLIGKLAAEDGHTIRVIDNLVTGSRLDLAGAGRFREISADGVAPMAEGDGAIELIIADIGDADLALAAVRGADVIVHLAASTGIEPSVADPRSDCSSNVIGTLNYLEAARQAGVCRFVFASSVAPIGEYAPPIHEELVPHPVSPYGASELAGEGYCSAYFRSFGIDTVTLRFGNVYGPGSGNKTSVVAKFVRRAMTGSPLEIYGDGKQTRDFIFVDDLTGAIHLSATAKDIGGEIFQIASNSETTIVDIVDELVPLLAGAGINKVKWVHSASRANTVRRNCSDTSKAERVLGWRAEVPLRDGLKRTIDWFLARPHAASAAE